MLLEYLTLLIFAIVIIFIIVLLPILSLSLVYQENYQEKISSYECGFEPFDNYAPQFEIRYYLLAILFLIFDLEIIYLMPWIINLHIWSFSAIISMLIFFFLLTLSFYYEWLRGGLEWD